MSTITKGMVTRVTIISHVCRIIGGGYCKLMKRTMVVEQFSRDLLALQRICKRSATVNCQRNDKFWKLKRLVFKPLGTHGKMGVHLVAGGAGNPLL